MKEERLQILNMLRDGLISPDEAERLLGALADTERAQSGGPHRKHRARFDFDFADIFGTKARSFSDAVDQELGEDFQQKMREFKQTMRGAGQEARRKAQEAMREAQDSLREAFEGSDLKDAFAGFGNTVAETIEAILETVKESHEQAKHDDEDESDGNAKTDEPEESKE